MITSSLVKPRNLLGGYHHVVVTVSTGLDPRPPAKLPSALSTFPQFLADLDLVEIVIALHGVAASSRHGPGNAVSSYAIEACISSMAGGA